MKKIVIEKGNEFKIYSRNVDWENDIFEEQYRAAEEIKTMLMDYAVSGEANDSSLEYLNNIIAFCGERGQGKSSAMVQFLESIKKQDADRLEILKTIDPTAMESVHELLDLVISTMFLEYQNKKDHDPNRFADDRKKQYQEFAVLFQNVHKNLAILKNAEKFIKEEYECSGTIQNLIGIANSMQLKQDMIRLVHKYLEERKKTCLVIAIDDLDLNIHVAYKMMEQIRKYLMIPRVIIVMALNIRQLTLCVEQQYLKAMNGLEASRWEVGEETKNMADKYIEKMIPLVRRLSLPDIRTLAGDGKDAVEVIYQEKSGKVLFHSENQGIEKGLMRLIYDRTGLLFVAEEGRIHPVVPKTMRSLVNLFSVIGNMEPEAGRNNVELFEQYLFNTWAMNNLKEEYREWFVKLKDTETDSIQSRAYAKLYEILEEKKWVGENPEFRARAIDSLNKTYNLVKRGAKIGNGRFILFQTVLNQVQDEAYSRLLFAVITYLSIIMLKFQYDGAEEKLLEFCGNDLFLAYRLIREDESKGSRTHYNFDLRQYWGRKIGQLVNPKEESGSLIELKGRNVSEIKLHYETVPGAEERLLETLYVLGCAATFQWQDQTERGLVSENNRMAEKASFSIARFLMRQASTRNVENNIKIERWVLKDQFESYVDRVWGGCRDICKKLICNLEVIRFINQYVFSRSNIRDKTSREDNNNKSGDREIELYYYNFFSSLNDGLLTLDTYIHDSICWGEEQGKKDELFKWQAQLLGDFWYAMENEQPEKPEKDRDELKEQLKEEQPGAGETAAVEFPSFVQKNCRIPRFKGKIADLKRAVEMRYHGMETTDKRDYLVEVQRLEKEFEQYAKDRQDTEQIGETWSKRFNDLRRSCRE